MNNLIRYVSLCFYIFLITFVLALMGSSLFVIISYILGETK